MYDANDEFLECKGVLHNYTKLKQRRSFNNLISNSTIAKNNIYKSYKE